MPNPNPDAIVDEYQSAALAQAGSAVEDDPDKAAKAYDLEKSTGVPGGHILDNFDEFQKDYHAAASQAIVRNNPHIIDYINSHPLAAKVSSDDWDKMDDYDQKLKNFVEHDSVTNALKGFVEGYNTAFPQGWYMSNETMATYPKLAAMSQMAMVPFEAPFRAISGVMEAIERGGTAALAPVMGEGEAGRFMRDIRGWVETYAGFQPGGEEPRHAIQNFNKIHEIARDAGIYLANNRLPPTGINSVLDQIKSKLAEGDAKQLQELLDASTHTGTRERSADLHASFTAQRTKDSTIGIEADALRHLYGDKVPAPDDGILGWVPNLAEKLETAEKHGGDVDVPLKDWLAKVDPDVAKELKDFIRTRPGGMTVNEGKNLELGSKMEEEPSLRDQAKEAEGQKDFAKMAELNTKEVHEQFPDAERTPSGVFRIPLTDDTGGNIGLFEFTVDDKAVHARYPFIESEYQSQGKGVEAYKKLVDFALASGREFQSDTSVSPSASRIYDALKRRGYDVVEREPGETGQPRYRVVSSPEAQVLANVRRAAGLGERPSQPALELKGLTPTKFTSSFFKGQSPEVEGHQISLSVALSQIKAGGYLGDFYNRIVGRINTATGHVPLYVVDDANWAKLAKHYADSTLGYYKPSAHHIVIPQSLFSLPNLAQRTILHEAVHAATNQALESNPVLGKAIEAIKNEVIAMFPKSAKQYGFSDTHEFLTETFSNPEFQKFLGETRLSPELARALHMQYWEGLSWWKAIMQTIAQFFNAKEPDEYTALEAAVRIGDLTTTLQAKSKSKIFERMAPLAQQAPKELQGKGSDLFQRARDIGLTEKEIRRRMALIEEQKAADKEFFEQQVLKDETKRQTAEWKQNEAKIREQVKSVVADRPDIAADEFLRTGIFKGTKLKGRRRINEAYLTDEQKASLPDDYYGKSGMHPDNVAALFGYDSGRSLIDSVASLQQARGNLGPKQYVNKLIANETEAQMQRQFGHLQENILQAAEEHVASAPEINLVHEEVLRAGLLAGAQAPLSKADIVAGARAAFNKLTAKDVSLEKFLRDSGKAGKLASIAGELEGDHAAAYRYRQQQEMALIMAAEAKKLEKAMTRFDRLAKRYEKRPEPGKPYRVDGEWANPIQDILQRIGKTVKRTPEDIKESMALDQHPDLRSFVKSKKANFRPIEVADFLQDASWTKNYNDLTVEEFKAVHDSVKTLDKAGRDERKLIREGDEEDFDKLKVQMIGQFKGFAEKHYDPEGKRWLLGFIRPDTATAIRTFIASHKQLEAVFRRWDYGDPNGVFTQWVMRPLAESANYESKLEKTFSKRVKELEDKVDLSEKVPNTVFVDPDTYGTPNQEFIPMTRAHLRAVMQYIGSPSGLDKLARGYKVDPKLVMDWVHNTATKEDWDWAQKQGEIFASIKTLADRLYNRLYGITAENIEIGQEIPASIGAPRMVVPLDTPFGKYKGWYHPIIYHDLWEGQSKQLIGGDLEDIGYYRATTPNGYMIKRTGYAAPISLTLTDTVGKMRQMLHDIAFREAIINASKVFQDKDIRAAIAKHYGVEYRDMLNPYLKDVANYTNTNGKAQAMWGRWSEFFRQNMIGTLIGYRYTTLLKHGSTAWVNSMTEVGPVRFLKAVSSLLSTSDYASESNWNFARNTSEELQRRVRHYQDTLRGTTDINLGKSTWRETLMAAGAYPVAFSDLLSAVPTWLAAYSKEMDEHGVHGDAVYAADLAVRKAHGSSVVTNRPAIMRDANPWFTSLYGFWSHIFNRQVEMLWQARDAIEGKRGYADATRVERTKAVAKTLTVGMMSYVIIPAIIEQWISGTKEDEKESAAKRWSKALVAEPVSGVIGLRELGFALQQGRDPAIGLLSTFGKDLVDVGRDLAKQDIGMDRRRAGRTLKDGVTAFGALTGYTNEAEGKVLQYLTNLYLGRERPKSAPEVFEGLLKGETKRGKR